MKISFIKLSKSLSSTNPTEKEKDITNAIKNSSLDKNNFIEKKSILECLDNLIGLCETIDKKLSIQ